MWYAMVVEPHSLLRSQGKMCELKDLQKNQGGIRVVGANLMEIGFGEERKKQ